MTVYSIDPIFSIKSGKIVGRLRRPGRRAWVSKIHLTDPRSPPTPTVVKGGYHIGAPSHSCNLLDLWASPRKFSLRNDNSSETSRHGLFLLLGLTDGKTKYAIGQEMTAWIKKLFEADVKPGT
jgi:hypothetical protein